MFEHFFQKSVFRDEARILTTLNELEIIDIWTMGTIIDLRQTKTRRDKP